MNEGNGALMTAFAKERRFNASERCIEVYEPQLFRSLADRSARLFSIFYFSSFFSSRSPIHAREGGRELNFYASECKHADVSPFIGDRS